MMNKKHGKKDNDLINLYDSICLFIQNISLEKVAYLGWFKYVCIFRIRLLFINVTAGFVTILGISIQTLLIKMKSMRK
jgi:hypothetical protein